LEKTIRVPYIQLLEAQELTKLGFVQAFLTPVATLPSYRGSERSCWPLLSCMRLTSEQTADSHETKCIESSVDVETEIVVP
jgi:hypothetical protein